MSPPRATLLLLALATVIALAVVPVAGAVADVSPTYHPLPTGYVPSGSIATAPNGDVWLPVTKSKNDNVATVARLRPSQASAGTSNGIATFPTPTQGSATCCASAVTSVAFDGVNDRLWFVQNNGIVGIADARSVVPGTTTGMTAKLLTDGLILADVAVRPDGSSWLTEYGAFNTAPYQGNRIALVNPKLQVNELDNLALQGHGPPLDDTRYDAKPDGITVDASGAPWFAESDPGNPGYRIATGAPGSYTEYLVKPCGSGTPCSGSYSGTGVTDVAVAPDGSKWFTNQLKNQIGRLDGGSFSNYDLSAIDPTLANGVPVAITTAPDGTLWVVDTGNAIIKIVPSQPTPTATVYHVGANTPQDVAADSTGNIWFPAVTPSGTGSVGELAGVVATASSGGGSTGGGGTGGGGTGGGGSTGGGGTPGQGGAGGGNSSGVVTAAPAPSTLTGPQPVALTPASTAVATVTPPQPSGSSVVVDQVCVAKQGSVCTVVYIVSSREYIAAFPGAKAAKARQPTVLRRQTVTIPGGSHKKVRITLNAKGRKLLKAHGRLSVFFTATQAASGADGPRLLKHRRLTLRRAKR